MIGDTGEPIEQLSFFIVQTSSYLNMSWIGKGAEDCKALIGL